MTAMNRQITCGNNIIKLINDLAASISPDGGNLDMAGMKGTLDADAARIKNPESAKSEKTEKEKKVACYYLVNADSVEKARKYTDKKAVIL